MRVLTLLIPVLLGAVVLRANPRIVEDEYLGTAYISAERLNVVVDAQAAVFDGQFVFTSSGSRAARLHLPIWIPEKAAPDQTALRAFLDKYALNRPVDLESRNRAEFDRLLNLSITAGKTAIPFSAFTVYETRPDQGAIPREWQRAGKLCVVVVLQFQLAYGEGVMRIRYTQPLVQKSADRGEFFYLPMFANLPGGQNTDDPAKYCMNITPQRCTLRIGGAEVKVGQTRQVSLKHFQPIVGEILRESRH